MGKLYLVDNETKECLHVIEKGEELPEPQERWEVVSEPGGGLGLFWNNNGWKTYEEWCNKQRQRRDKYMALYIDRINAVRWESMPPEQREAWSAYRKALLDLPQQGGFPRNIIWPSKP